MIIVVMLKLDRQQLFDDIQICNKLQTSLFFSELSDYI